MRLRNIDKKIALNHFRDISFFLIPAMIFLLISCDRGLKPPFIEPNPAGVIQGTVSYSGSWPAADSLIDLRFVPLRSEPQSVFEIFSDLENLRFSNRLQFNVKSDTFIVEDVQNGAYAYNIIAQQFGNNPLADWRPVALYTDNDGVIIVEGDTVNITIQVDFENPPAFPFQELER